MAAIIKPTVKIIDKKERQRRIQYICRQSRNSFARVGILNAKDAYPGTQVTVGQVAAWMEFGTKTAKGNPGVPARSFLRTPIDAAMPNINKVRMRALNDILSEKISIAEALERLGFFVSNLCKNSILRGLSPGLAYSTRQEKRKDRPNKGVSPTPDTPLMDTSLLISRIGYEIILESGG